jgi:hypothetical protein
VRLPSAPQIQKKPAAPLAPKVPGPPVQEVTPPLPAPPESQSNLGPVAGLG